MGLSYETMSTHKTISIQRRLLSCTAAELRELAAFIERILPERDREERQDLEDAMTKRGEVLERRQGGTWTYCLQPISCGKANCRCASGKLHGPYWYAYRSVAGRTISRYVGKTFKPIDDNASKSNESGRTEYRPEWNDQDDLD